MCSVQSIETYLDVLCVGVGKSAGSVAVRCKPAVTKLEVAFVVNGDVQRPIAVHLRSCVVVVWTESVPGAMALTLHPPVLLDGCVSQFASENPAQSITLAAPELNES